MKRLATRLEGPVLLEPTVHGDARGFFLETFRASTLAELGLHDEWVQDNHSRSARGVLRGMHFQPGMAKLVRCARGAILDVLVDIRPGSASFGRWEGFELDDRTHRELYAPDGFAHGFCVTSEIAQVVYKCTDFYDPEGEISVQWNDPDLKINWPLDEIHSPILSKKDFAAKPLRQLMDVLPWFDET